ncbi:signal recognition particle-docking protein FtsY [Parvularcula sp. IMCC14364]|uniref:signal recognition particle-docking protein FtsY n=1 Tax=Parvularcula sp. IMCC14364 TaxID=3067902 RepID=UPI002741504C|nr:signal recognition particle-docking protein FtsY [Parvularcula sp. IMCC14364]
MSEKKGFLGRLFGRDKKPDTEEQGHTPENDADTQGVEQLPADDTTHTSSEADPAPEPATQTTSSLDEEPAKEKPGFFSGLFGDGGNTEETKSDAPSIDEAAIISERREVAEKLTTQVRHELQTAFAGNAEKFTARLQEETIPPLIQEERTETADEFEIEIEAEETAPDLPDMPELEEPEPEKKRGFFGRLTQGLSKSSAKLSGGVSAIFTKRKLDDDTLEELEDLLITADLGVPAATRITTALAKDKFDKEISDTEVRKVLAEEIAGSLLPLEKDIIINPANRPHVILMTGVNGAGKTTTIGKLARKFSGEGKSVMLAAGDTFRAAAIEQLAVWGARVGAPVISRAVGADAAGLAYDALQEARAQNIDVLMIDTAGRLQNRTELMDELAKIVRVIRKLDETAPHDTILVLDATVGQNAISQAEVFTQIAGVSGLIMTKLDGTARGGVLVALADKFSLPVHYVGVGESVEDLQPFSAENFTRALTGIEELTVKS